MNLRRCVFAGLVLLLLPGGAPASAGSCSGGSIMSRTNAIADASSCMPPGAQITGEHCITMIRDMSPRYQCSVTWSVPATSGP